MHCASCGISIIHGVSLYRQNDKGVSGIFKCKNCIARPVDQDMVDLVETIEASIAIKEKEKQSIQ